MTHGDLPISSADEEILAHALSEWQRNWGWARQPSLSELLDRWQSFVVGVQAGYKLTLDDYSLELAIRDDLDVIIQQLTPALRGQVAAVLLPWDTRMLAATESIVEPLPGAPDAPSSIWWSRIPKVLVGQFAKDVLSQGPFSVLGE